jgi:hypothetical protein
MALQELETIPKDLFVDFDGLSVRPKIEYLGKMAKEIPVLARQDGLRQIYTDGVVSVYNSLMKGRKDSYSSLSKKQQFVKDGTYSKESGVDILSNFGKEFLESYWIWAELGPDWQPEKRRPGYSLPEGSNAVLYRNWGFSGDKIDVSNAEAVPVRWMEKYGNVSKEIIRELNVPDDTHVWADRESSVKDYDGLSALFWGFWISEGPYLDSDGEPRGRYSNRGALLGSVGSDRTR